VNVEDIEDYEYSERPEGGFRFRVMIAPVEGTELVDVTDHIAMMYDLIMAMDGACSGWCDAEDNERLADIAQLCGFELPECIVPAPQPGPPGVCRAGKVRHDGPHKMTAYVPTREVTW
jgi:hypothetical protein